MGNNNDNLSLNRESWSKIAEKYDKYRPDWLKESTHLFDFFCENIYHEGYVLDMGSGTGLPYARLLIKKGFKVLGIDISPNMIKIAKRNVPQAEFKELSLTDLNYNNIFDGVISSFSMLLLNPKQFKNVAKRIVLSLKKDGLLYLSLNEPWEEGVDVDKEAIISIMGEKMYSRAYTKEEILEIFTPLGLKLLKFERKIQSSELFGEEHTTTYVLELV